MVDGLQRIAAAAGEAGVRLGLEPIHRSERDALTMITSIPETLELLEEAELPKSGSWSISGIVGDTPDDRAHLADHVGPITGLHVADWFADDRGRPRAPRPGRLANARAHRVLRERLATARWTSRSSATPTTRDSLWSLDVDEAARRAYAAIASVNV